MTNADAVDFYRPAPLFTIDGDYATVSDLFYRGLRDGVFRYWRGSFDLVPLVRWTDYLIDRVGASTWFVGSDGKDIGRKFGYFGTNTALAAIPIDPNHDYTLAVRSRWGRVEWYWLLYSVHRGWEVSPASVEAYDSHYDDEGYPRLCDMCDQPEEVKDVMQRVFEDEIDEAENYDLASLGAIFADYFDDGRDLCTDHFYEANAVVDLSETQLADVERHAIAAGMGTFSTKENEPIQPTRADVDSLVDATRRFAEALEEEASRVKSMGISAAAAAYEIGDMTRDEAIAVGVGAGWLDLTDQQKNPPIDLPTEQTN